MDTNKPVYLKFMSLICFSNSRYKLDFFHKMKTAAEDKTVVLFTDDRYLVAKNLWTKVEKQIPIL